MMLFCVRVTYSTGTQCVFRMDDFGNFADEVRDGQVGETWAVELIEMGREEFENLPEFTGP